MSGAPEPVSFHSRGFGYVAEIFPPRSRQNSTEKPLCYFYEVGYGGGTEWKIDAKLKWQAPLVNDSMPYQAVVSMQGRLVTLNEYITLGYKNSVAIYSLRGTLVKTYPLDILVPTADMAKIDTSISSRWWNENAKYYFLENSARLYIGLPTDFGDLRRVLAKGDNANEVTEIWMTSLRFSSITDVLAAKAMRGVR